MPHSELPQVTEDEARADLEKILNRATPRAIQHLRRKAAETGGIHGECHGRCIIGSLAEDLGYRIDRNKSSSVLKIRPVRRLLGVPEDPNELTPIEVFCLGVKPSHTASNSRVLAVVVEVCDRALSVPYMRTHRGTPAMV